MDGLRAGAAYSLYALDLSQFDRDVARVKKDLADLARQADQPVPGPRLVPPTSGQGGANSAAAQRAAIAEQRLATEQQRTAATASQAATAEQRLATERIRTTTATAQATAAQTRAEQAAIRLAQAQQRLARESSGVTNTFTLIAS